MSHIPTEVGSYSIGISHFGQIYQDAKLEIFSIYDKLEYVNPEQSVGTPTDARGAIVVGALGNSASMPYSSIGPTDNGLNVPQILSPDGFVVSSLGQKPFYGTSSSAAYVAGLIAVLLSAHPELQSQIGANSFTELQFDSSDLVIDGFAGKLENTGDTQDTVYTNSDIPESDAIQDGIHEVEAIKEQVVQQMLSPDDSVNQVLNELQNLSLISEQNESLDAPPWFSNVISWWLDNKISDAEFVTSVNYLRNNGILD
ncbi:S8 family serine peptidase [Candidatus Nitrosotenuis chungbukensis]|uniref:S8 family serine peptidase n=1 Tax=Candidatus Nitrosotenuis chungbukensis TaxID=1353246 RepID=UPI002671E6C6|nr:S8 family serine peptidase [Candidatus Nitrosotenuis chungbukensis]WKT58036.1 S8 family serine peptidase [Candidatus Nitrosotenuis chungbukensis]